MACFWKGILNLLDLKELNLVFELKLDSKPRPKHFIKYLKKYNCNVAYIKHNGALISEKEAIEHFNRIKSIKPKESGDGYLCSGCEPVFFLISHLFRYNIKHVFCENTILYTHPNPKGELVFGSNPKHFYSIEKVIQKPK